MHLDGNPQDAHRLLKKRPFLPCDSARATLRSGRQRAMGIPGKPAPEPKSSSVAIPSGRARAQAMDSTKCPEKNSLLVANRGEIHARIPAKDQCKIGFEPAGLLCRQWLLAGLGQQLLQPLAGCKTCGTNLVLRRNSQDTSLRGTTPADRYPPSTANH